MRKFTLTSKIINALKVLGPKGFISNLIARWTKRTAGGFGTIRQHLLGKSGIEIGGPSKIFERGNLIPLYPIISQLDGCNFAEQTIWSHDGNSYIFQDGKTGGRQFIDEASQLKSIDDESYDFLLASHVIEHVANPIKAVQGWRRVVKKDGYLLIVIPHKDGTFDHLRPITAFRHLLDDLENNTDERDLTHLPEILKFHDLGRDPLAGSFAQFKKRAEENFLHRTMHHHVFGTQLALGLLDYCHLQILTVDIEPPYHIILLGKNVAEETFVDNSRFLGVDAAFRNSSPFNSDKHFEI